MLLYIQNVELVDQQNRRCVMLQTNGKPINI